MTSGAEGDTERLLRSLPLPLAQLLRRAVNAKSSVERHNNAYYLAEAALKLAAAARIGVWLDKALDTKSELARALEALTLPSAGHWLSLLRDLDADLGKRADAALLPLGSTFGRLAQPSEGWAAVTALANAAAESSAVSADVAKAASREGILGFFGLVVAYRNSVLGHGAQRRGSFYEEFEHLWIKALTRVLDAPALFGGLRLAYTRLDQSGAVAWQDLTGVAGFPMGGKPGAAKVAPSRLYFVGPDGLIPIHPIAVYREDDLGHESVGILNKTTRRTRRDTNEPVEEVRRADYLDYATGENLQGVDAREALTVLLGKLRGKSVSEEDAKLALNVTAAAVAEEEVDEVMSSGAALGDFELLEEVGRGGMGIVYRARQRSLHRVVALKVLPPALASDPTAVERFKREVSALARCDHPNIIKVFTSAVDGDRHYFAMEYVEGVDLARAGELLSEWRSSGAELRGGHLAAAASARKPAATGKEIALATGEKIAAPALARDAGFHKRLAALFAGAARGLHHLHEKGIVHRDVKPGNLMLTVDGARIVVMDLGLAKLADESRGLTKSDVKVLGTLRYMPPEQLVRKLATVDARADVYALGASLYELATGRPLLEGDTEAELVHQVLAVEPTRADKVDRAIPRSLATILAVATAKDPKHRYENAQALADDLQAFAEDRPIAASPPGLGRRLVQATKRNRAITGAVAAIAVIAVGGASGWWWYDHPRVSFCASVALRRGVLTCATSTTASEQAHRGRTYRFTERRGRVMTVALVAGDGLLALDDEASQKDGAAKWDYAYRDDGRVEHVVVTSKEGDFLRREVFSDDGARVEHHDRNDQPQKIEGTDVSVRRLGYDDAGFVTKVTFANVYGSPRPDARGAFGYAYVLDAHGLASKETALSASGAPSPTKEGWVERSIERDANGDETRVVYLDGGKKPTNTQRGYAARSSKYDEHGDLVESAVEDALGRPAIDHANGASRITFKRDEHGLPVETAIFGVDGRPTLGVAGWALQKTTSDASSRTVTRDYFGVDGKPALVSGVARETAKHDATGHIIEVRYFGVEQKPTTCEKGYSVWTKRFDALGSIVEETFAGVDGRPTAGTLGFARITRTFDDRGNPIALAYFGVDGSPTLGERGCASATLRYDDRGNTTEYSCFGVDTKPKRSLAGWSTRRATYDERGNETEVSFVDVDGAPFAMNGVARETSHYDERGDMVEHAYFGVDTKPTISKWGYAEFTQRFDEHGNLTEQRFFGLDHRPILGSEGVAGMAWSYDERGNEIEQYGLGLDGKPALNKYKFVFNQWSYDANGRRAENRRLDANRAPTLSDDGMGGWRKTFDESGRETSVVYLGIDGLPHARKDGAVGARVWNASDGRSLRRVAFDAQGQPIAGTSEVSEISWRTVDGKRVITDLRMVQLVDPTSLAAAESKIAAWSMGQKMAALHDTNPAAFHGSKGALVVVVAPDGQASRIGLAPGDVILDVGGHAVNRPQDVQESIDLGAHSMLVLRDGKELHLDVAPGSLGATLEPE